MSVDLLSWVEVREARAALAAAVVRRDHALRRSRCAPRGETLTRAAALSAATVAVLQAELAVRRAEAAE